MNVPQPLQRFMMGGLTCEEASRLLDDYLDGRLDPKVRRQFETHLRRCEKCAIYLEQYRATIDVVRADGCEAYEVELIDTTLDFLRAHLPQDGRPTV